MHNKRFRIIRRRRRESWSFDEQQTNSFILYSSLLFPHALSHLGLQSHPPAAATVTCLWLLLLLAAGDKGGENLVTASSDAQQQVTARNGLEMVGD